MSLRRSLLAMLLMFGLMVGSIATAVAGSSPASNTLVAAQQQDDDATPDADDEDDAGARPDDEEEATDDEATDEATDDTAEGDVVDNVAVEVVDERGDPYLSITVTETIDDWDEYDEYSEPERGIRYVALNVTIENIGDRDEEVSDYDVFIRDEQGFIYGTGYVSVLEDAEDQVFEGGELAPGDSLSGLMIFAVPADAQIVDAFYAPSGRLITIATLGGEAIEGES